MVLVSVEIFFFLFCIVYVKNNNVLFADKNWKIVKINGDGSIKLVLDGVIDELSKYLDNVIKDINVKKKKKGIVG